MKIETISLELIDPDPLQPRTAMDEGELEALAQSLKTVGQLQPIIVVGAESRFMVLDGHRRVAAAKRAGGKALFGHVLAQRPTPEQTLVLQLQVNCLRSDLKPIEKARAIERLMKAKGLSHGQLAGLLQMSKSSVTQLLSYLTLPAELQARIDSGELAGSTAYAIARAPDEASRHALVAKAMGGALSRSEAQQRVKRPRDRPRERTRMVCRLPSATVSIEIAGRLGLDGIGSILRRLGQECRAASQQGYDPGTLERILAAKCRSQIHRPENGSSSSSTHPHQEH